MGLRVEAHGLEKTYGDIRAVDGITFTVEPGEFFGLLGPNGAGKTTALEILEGLRRPDAGRNSATADDAPDDTSRRRRHPERATQSGSLIARRCIR